MAAITAAKAKAIREPGKYRADQTLSKGYLIVNVVGTRHKAITNGIRVFDGTEVVAEIPHSPAWTRTELAPQEVRETDTGTARESSSGSDDRPRLGSGRVESDPLFWCRRASRMEGCARCVPPPFPVSGPLPSPRGSRVFLREGLTSGCCGYCLRRLPEQKCRCDAVWFHDRIALIASSASQTPGQPLLGR